MSIIENFVKEDMKRSKNSINSLEKTSNKLDILIGFNLLPDKTIEIVSKKGGIKKNKYISPRSLIEIIESSYIDSFDDGKDEVIKEIDNTGLLPNTDHIKTLKVVKYTENKVNIYLLREKKPVTMNFENDYFNDVKLPKIIFKVSLNNLAVTKANAYAIKDNFVSKDTKLFRYPLSNVTSNGSICFGGINRPKYDSIQNAFSFPDFFLSTKMNMDYFAQNNNSKMSLRPFLEKLSESEEFDENLLISSDITFDMI